MVTLQILNKILDTGDMGLILKNGLTVDYFIGYEDEFTFLYRPTKLKRLFKYLHRKP